MNEGKKEDKETLEYAVYGGIIGILGVLSLMVLFIAVLECKPAIVNAIIRSIICAGLGVLTVHFGYRAKKFKQGQVVIILGVTLDVFVIILYIVGIIPCLMS